MTKRRSKIPPEMHERLLAEAGQKCANPGCPNIRTHIHHIKEWAVYQTHDERYMIAVCPSCHFAIHHGAIALTDEVVLAWKGIDRTPNIARHHIYVEPKLPPETWFGGFAVRLIDRGAVINLSPTNSVSMQIVDSELLSIDATLTALDGTEILRVRNSHVLHRRMSGVEFLSIPGQCMVAVSPNSPLIPKWFINRMRGPYPHFGTKDHMITLFHAHAYLPGVVRVGGIWIRNDRALVAGRELFFVSRTHPDPVIVRAQQEGKTVINVTTPLIDNHVFGFADEPALFRFQYLDPTNGPLPIDHDED
jgi:hypothetical protein